MLDPRWRKVVRDLLTNKSRTSLVVLSIAIGIIGFGGLFIARTVIVGDLLSQYPDTNPSNIVFTFSPFDDELVRWAIRQEHVTGAQGRALYRVRLIYGGKAHNVNLYAFDDYENIQIDRIYPQEGRWPPGKDEILIERSFLPLIGTQIGEQVTIELPNGKQHELRYVGTVHDLSVMPGVLQPEVSAYVSRRTLYTLGFPALFNQLEITVSDGSNPSNQAVQSEPIDIVDGLQRKLRHLGIPVHAVTVREANEGYWAADPLKGIVAILLVMGFSSLALSGFLVFNTISGLIARQKNQIGIMKIIGASREQIVGIYLVMVTGLGLAAFIIALPVSLGLAQLLAWVVVWIYNFNSPDFYIPFQTLLLEGIMALIVPLTAALMPILNGTRITAAAAISDAVVQSRTGLFDIVLAKIGGLPRPLLLSLRNTFRRKARLLITFITLALAGALFISIFNVRESMNDEVYELLSTAHFDVRLTLDGLYRGDEIVRRVEQVPGVTYVEGWAISHMRRVRPDDVRGASIPVYGLLPDTPFVSPRLDQGRWLQPDDQYATVIDREWLKDEPDIQLGDTITLELNGKRHDWRVVGFLKASFNPAIYVPYEYLSRFRQTPDQIDTVIIRTLNDNAAFQQAVTEALEDYLDQRDIDLTYSITGSEITAGITAGFVILVIILMGMALLVAAIGGLGLAGTMSLNVLERTREIGVMRAVGAGTGAVRRIFLTEGILIGLVSWLAAVPLSVPGTQLLNRAFGEPVFGRSLPYIFLLEGPLIWLIIVTVIAALFTLMPANRASQISIREALSTLV